MTPRPPAIRVLMSSPAVMHASPTERDWLAAILVRGEKRRGAGKPEGRRTEVFGREEAPVREGNPGH